MMLAKLIDLMKSQEKLVIEFTAVRIYIKEHENEYRDDTKVCRVFYDITNTYCADYSTDKSNEATLVRNTIDTFFRTYFPNSPLTKSIGADTMISDTSKRFTRLDPSLKNHEESADFSVVSNKSDHVLLSLEAKSSKTKHINEIVKLCRELKDSMKAICNDGYSEVVICGIFS